MSDDRIRSPGTWGESLDLDDGAPTPALADVAALMLRRSLRCAAAGRITDAVRLLRLHRGYRKLLAAQPTDPDRDSDAAREARHEQPAEVQNVHDVHRVSAPFAAPRPLQRSPAVPIGHGGHQTLFAATQTRPP